MNHSASWLRSEAAYIREMPGTSSYDVHAAEMEKAADALEKAEAALEYRDRVAA